MKDGRESSFVFSASLWIDATAVIILCCIAFSCVSRMTAGAWSGFIGALALAVFRIRRRARENDVGGMAGMADWIRRGATALRPRCAAEWGVAALVALAFVGLCLSPHCFLDSYSYRFPQMFFWLQEGHPWSIANVDPRINQMPHAWPMLSAAFYLPFGERAVAVPNFISYLFLVALFRRWAAAAAPSRPTLQSALALVFSAAPVFVLGAATNDNTLTCATFLALSFELANASAPTRRTVTRSALAFALCCGIKPQYAVLAPVWGAWFLLAPSRPFRQFSWKTYAVLLPVLLLCSPVPTFAYNQARWGSFKMPKVVDVADSGELAEPAATVRPKHPRNPAWRSFAVLGLQMADVPLNPFYGRLNEVVARKAPRLRFTFRPLLIAESASMGLLAFLPFVVGLVRTAFRRDRAILLSLAVLPLACCAIAFMEPGTLGRS